MGKLTFTVRNKRTGDAFGKRWLVRVLEPGVRGPLVEFYDTSYADSFQEEGPGQDWGQFVTRYYLADLLGHAEGAWLILDTGVPGWLVDGPAMDAVMAWLRPIGERLGVQARGWPVIDVREEH